MTSREPSGRLRKEDAQTCNSASLAIVRHLCGKFAGTFALNVSTQCYPFGRLTDLTPG